MPEIQVIQEMQVMQVSFLPNNLYHQGHLSKRFQDLKETQEDLGPEPVPSGVENIPVPWCW